MSKNITSQVLCKAIQENDLSKVRSILAIQDVDCSSCVDEQNSDGWSALMFAAKHNDVETAQDLIKRRLEVDIYDFRLCIKGIVTVLFISLYGKPAMHFTYKLSCA
jgi:ankyrin repeat protein